MHPRSVSAYKLLLYDAYCPSVQPVINRRICKKCGLYHASLSSLKMHQRLCGVQDIVTRIRLTRIAARRQRELMAIIAVNEAEDAEWLDEEDVDLVGIGMSINEPLVSPLPLVTISDHLHNIWS